MTITAPRHAAAADRIPARRRRPSDKPRRRVTSRIFGVIGEIFITLGVLGILFVVWELWWTGLDADRERREAEEEFFSGIQELQAAPENPGAGTDAGNETGTGTDTSFEVCMTLENGTEIGCAPTMTDRAESGEVLGMLYSPRLGDNWAAPIRHGVGAAQLDTGGVGHYPSSQMPDEPGNFALAGHRQTYGNMLGDQHLLEPGDHLYLYSPDGIYTYQVYESYVVQPHQTEVIAAVPGEPGLEAETGVLTLTTCHPLFSNAERLITHAEIVDFEPLSGDVPEAIAHHVNAQPQAGDTP